MLQNQYSPAPLSCLNCAHQASRSSANYDYVVALCSAADARWWGCPGRMATVRRRSEVRHFCNQWPRHSRITPTRRRLGKTKGLWIFWRYTPLFRCSMTILLLAEILGLGPSQNGHRSRLLRYVTDYCGISSIITNNSMCWRRTSTPTHCGAL